MRLGRIKIPSEEGEAVYHCVTRVVNGERIIDDVSKEMLRRQLRLVAEYCGVEIFTYAVMSNHFHVLVKVPAKVVPSDQELLRRYRLLYPKPSRFKTERLYIIETHLKSDSKEGVAWRQRQMALMHDVSMFMKLVKQRFSIWFNKTHSRFGTLWAERFKSVLIEPKHHAIQTIALYIDLNAVRAGLVDDPKDYRFCGYGEAGAGGPAARQGLQSLWDSSSQWEKVQSSYRIGLFGTAADPRPNARSLPVAAFQKVLKEGGQLSLQDALRCRVRYFTDGAVLGSEAFVRNQLAVYRDRYGTRAERTPCLLPPVSDWGDLTAMRGLRRNAFC